uniref:Uncharacterized protein n=1 Tax=Ditylenchus dipsaci TaxID=166011 RepID=A0A915DLC2_9BILA
MIRMPAGVDIIYRTEFNSNETFVRVLVGDKLRAPIASTMKITQSENATSPTGSSQHHFQGQSIFLVYMLHWCYGLVGL